MTQRKLFGTDGIRGHANIYPMTGEIAMALGRAVTHYFQKTLPENKRPLIIVGKDTRLSCYMLEQAFAAGVCSQGGKVIFTAPLPTPGVAFVTESMRADAGVVISASHNKFSDNGIKIFDGRGYKLPDSVEVELEQMVFNQELIPTPDGSNLGNAVRLDEVTGRYIVHVKSAFPASYDLSDIRIVLDCANGAGYKVGPMVFRELGAEVVSIGVGPNGTNINSNCGSLYPKICAENVLKYRADIGVCLDGDADRVIIIDENGEIIDGDKIIGTFAKYLVDKGVLKQGDKVVGTVMSNLGLERYIEQLGLKFHRTQVGDRYIIEYMRSSGTLFGGEPSGHVIFKQHSKTGDGILSALKILECKKFYNKSINELISNVELYPQLIKNVQVSSKPPFESIRPIQEKLKEAQKKMGNKGRVLLRYSGTEPLARIMVEGEDNKTVEDVCNELIDIVSKELS